MDAWNGHGVVIGSARIGDFAVISFAAHLPGV
jgi:hypothetical protein